MTNTQTDVNSRQLLRHGLALEFVTLSWNVVGIVVLAISAVSARSVALAGFGLDSLIEIGASMVVLWELSGTGEHRQRRALHLIGDAFGLLAVYLLFSRRSSLWPAITPGTRCLASSGPAPLPW